jgi:hypothetical protein
VSIVGEYWAGVLQRLEAEVQVFAQLVAHEGERGRENEAVLARVLSALVPGRYGVGSGLLIDTRNAQSAQTDVILYDHSDEPAVLAQTTQILFPVESVLACIEVKTTLRGDDIADSLEKAKKQRALHHERGGPHPLFVVLAYRAGQTPATIVKKYMNADASERPDLVCVVEQAVLIGSGGSIRDGSGAEMDAGLALLHENGEAIEGRPEGTDFKQVHAGRQYPIVRHEGRLLLVEPSRALLLFVEALVRLLAERQGRAVPVLSLYVDQDMRELAWYPPPGADNGVGRNGD